MVWFLVPGAYSFGSTQILMTAERPVLATATRARSSADSATLLAVFSELAVAGLVHCGDPGGAAECPQ